MLTMPTFGYSLGQVSNVVRKLPEQNNASPSHLKPLAQDTVQFGKAQQLNSQGVPHYVDDEYWD